MTEQEKGMMLGLEEQLCKPSCCCVSNDGSVNTAKNCVFPIGELKRKKERKKRVEGTLLAI